MLRGDAEMDSDLIGFENSRPVMKKLRTDVGKQVILNGTTSAGKIYILNKKNVKIPVKLCSTVPESVRKVVLSKLPSRIDNDKNSYLNTNLAKDKISSSGHGGVSLNLDNKTRPDVKFKINIVKSDAKVTIQKTIDTKTVNKSERIENKLKDSSDMDGLSRKTKLNRKRRMQMLRQQTIKREVMKCFKQSMKSRLKPPARTRSISCQTETVTCSSSCQTEEVQVEIREDIPDMLDLFLEPEKDFLIDPMMNYGKCMLDTGNSPLHSTTFADAPSYGGIIDQQKLKFYYYLKNCNVTDAVGHIPLHLGVLNNDPNEVHNQCLMLKTRCISVDIPNNNGMTPLHLAVQYECNINILETLLKNEADPLVKDGEGNTSIHNAVLYNKSKDILMMLLDNVKDRETVDVFNYEGFTPLMLCVIEDKYEMAKECVKAGADPNTKDQKSGRTSLFHAVENNNLELVRLFMKNGANTKIKNFFGTSTHEATFELENIDHYIKSLIICKETCPSRLKTPVTRRKKPQEKSGEPAPIPMKNKLTTVRILKVIPKKTG